MSAPTRQRLPAGGWHFQHGPIDLVIQAEGEPATLAAAHEDAWQDFQGVLGELVGELRGLRSPVGEVCPLRGALARRMWQACSPWRQPFITPMAAVAGAVAERIVAHYRRDGVARAWVNNGGDIALHLTPGTHATVGLYADLAQLDAAQLQHGLLLDGQIVIAAALPVRGVATSGWRGRSQSLGIADAVTVLAADAAVADAAATVIANAVDVDAPDIRRLPACQVKDDSDLGERLVTVEVPALHPELVRHALQAGQRCASLLHAQGHIHAALLCCQGQARVVAPAAGPPSTAGLSARVGSVLAT